MKLTELTETEYASVSESKVDSLKHTEGFAEITSAFEKVHSEIAEEKRKNNQSTLKYFRLISKREIENIPVRYTKEDITKFTFSLATRSEEEIAISGTFLTDLIMNHYKKNRWNRFLKNAKTLFSLKTVFSNTNMNEEYTIITENLPCINYFGYDLNGPKVKIFGDIGHCLGEGMKSGRIIVTGNCRDRCGSYMEGGKIIIEGNAKDFVGKEMKGGIIHILGNAGFCCGARMKKGSIFINGDVTRDLGYEMNGGFISIKGNAGKDTASFMCGGILEIKGNTGISCGLYMKRGLVTIQGNCGNSCGYHMEGGTIHIKGNAGHYIGYKMMNGRIYVEGEYYDETVQHHKCKGGIFVKED